MAGVRMTGLVSGLDTESLVSELSKAYQTKVDNAKKKQTKAEWKKEAWQELNTKLMNFYKGALSTFKSTGTYNTKSVTGSLSGVKVTAGTKAANGIHTVQVVSTASAKMQTGHKVAAALAASGVNTFKATSYVAASGTDTDGNPVTMKDIYNASGNSLLNTLNGASFTVKVGEEETTIALSNDDGTNLFQDTTKVSDVAGIIQQKLEDAGISSLNVTFENGAFQFENTSTDDIKITGSSVLGLTGERTVNAAVTEEDGTTTNGSVKGSTVFYQKVQKETSATAVTGATRLTDLGIAAGTTFTLNTSSSPITVNNTTTLSSLASALSSAGINANYDTTQGRFYLSSKKSGDENAFTLESSDEMALKKLGLYFEDEPTGGYEADSYSGIIKASGGLGKEIAASNATIEYNGVTYTQATNTFSINGLSITASAAGEKQEFSVDTDVDGIYDKVKNFVKEYNALIKEMNTLYDANSSKGYEPLTSEEKDAMTDDEVEKWEKTIKDSLLRRDSTISSLLSNMRTMLSKSVEVDGTKYSLSSFGIVTSSYTEKGQLHILGDSEDSDFADEADKLKAAIAANPDVVTKTLSDLGNQIYTYMQKAMKSTESSSALTFYDDVTLDKEIKDYKSKVTSLQDKLTEMEDKYYKQFSAMESAMSKLQSQQNYVSQLFGNG